MSIKGSGWNSDRAVSAKQLFFEGVKLQQAGQLDSAQAVFERILAMQPREFNTLHALGVVVAMRGDLNTAEELFRRALAINPKYFLGFVNLGNVQRQIGKREAALKSLDRARALRPDEPEVHNARGVLLADMKKYPDAIRSFDLAISLKPDYAAAYNNRGNALLETNNPRAALASIEQALARSPEVPEFQRNRALALYELGEYEAAVAVYRQVLATHPDDAEAFNGLCVAYGELRRFDMALDAAQRASELRKDYAEALFNLGTILSKVNRYPDAIESFKRALVRMPEDAQTNFMLQHARMKICDWREFDEGVRKIERFVRQGENLGSPFPLLGLTDDPGVQLRAATNYVRRLGAEAGALGPIPIREGGKKIRIGYFSADFHDHATMYLMAGLFERHDKDKFELVAFSFGPDKQDGMRARATKAFDRFIDVTQMSHLEVAKLARSLEIDIAIDLKGYTDGARTEIFAHRVAPVQVNYLGYPGTMGAGFMDYLIADPVLVPESHRQHYSEKIVDMPYSYQVNDSERGISDEPFTREEAGLPEAAFVFCDFNSNYKITPATFDMWMMILHAVDGAVLWLLEDCEAAADNLRTEARARGVDPKRLVFAPRIPLDRHLARIRLADLFLDTEPYNAHTTLSDALWAGVPAVTLLGDSFAGRVGASLLNAIGLAELVVTNRAGYVSLATALATSPQRIAALRGMLLRNRLNSPLFDTASFARHLETAFTMIQQRYLDGLPPAHLSVGG